MWIAWCSSALNLLCAYQAWCSVDCQDVLGACFGKVLEGEKNLCCIWEVDCRIISLSKHPCLLRCFSNCLDCFVQCCVCLELSGNSQIIGIYGRHIFGNTYWRMFFSQNLHFPGNAVRAWFDFFSSSLSAFLPVQKMLKRNIPCLSDVDSTFMLLIFFYCLFFFFWSPVSGPFLQFHKSPHPFLSPHYCKFFCLFPCWHLLLTTLWCICANLFFSFSCLCLYSTDFWIILL